MGSHLAALSGTSRHLPTPSGTSEPAGEEWLLRVPEAAEILNLGARTLYRMLAEGETFGDSVIRFSPRCTRFSRKRLEAYLAGESLAS
jgi:excisionase family DNA binding protein